MAAEIATHVGFQPAARYDRHAATVRAFLHLACALISLRSLARAEAGLP